jgi:hypothetical protein
MLGDRNRPTAVLSGRDTQETIGARISAILDVGENTRFCY